MKGIKLAHFSDLHFGRFVWDPEQFRSKRWLGNANLALLRQGRYQTEHFSDLAAKLASLQVDHACITGDFATTSRDEEFEEARAFLKKFPVPYFLIPGNHDCYTKEAEETKRFYHFFPEANLKSERITLKPLGGNWWWIGMDTTISTPCFNSYGIFTEELEKRLASLLESLPEDAHVVVANHYPIYRFRGWRHELNGRERLEKLLRSYPKVKLYLHGHDHGTAIHLEGGLLTVCGGSIARKKVAPFSIFELYKNELRFQRYTRSRQNDWQVSDTRILEF